MASEGRKFRMVDVAKKKAGPHRVSLLNSLIYIGFPVKPGMTVVKPGMTAVKRVTVVKPGRCGK